MKKFKIVARVSLQVNLTKASNKWQGQIIRLYIRCVDGHLNQTGETHCVLIKFSGEFKSEKIDVNLIYNFFQFN